MLKTKGSKQMLNVTKGKETILDQVITPRGLPQRSDPFCEGGGGAAGAGREGDRAADRPIGRQAASAAGRPACG